MTVEVCIESVQAAELAEAAGASRLELNCALSLDGLTPPPGLIQMVRESVNIPILGMVRIRSGNFVYTTSEWKTMQREVPCLLDLGLDGLVFGALNDNSDVHVQFGTHFCELARRHHPDCELVFHKAFDQTREWPTALDQIIECGFDRVMTSGQSPSALEGVENLAAMIRHAGENLEILPAGGVRSENAGRLISETGCNQLHGSFRKSEGPMDREEEADFIDQITATCRAFQTRTL